MNANGAELSEIIVSQSPDAVIFANPDGRIAVWNQAAQDIFGFTKEEALGQSLDLIVPERFRAAHWKGFDRALREGHTKYDRHPMTTRSLNKSRDPFYVDLAFEILKDKSGRVIGAMATARDATEKYISERNLKKEFQRLQEKVKNLEAHERT